MSSSNKVTGWIFIWGLLCIFGLSAAGTTTSAVTRIMPLGNSLTAGMTDAGSDPIGGYRDDLSTLLTNEGISFDFVGGQSDGSGFDNEHEGHPGWPVDSINVYLDGWLTTHTPEVVLFMGGTNDVFEERATQEIIDNIEIALDKIYNYDPNTKIVLSSIIPRRDGLNNHTIEVNDEILNLYYAKLNDGYKIYYAGHFEMFIANPNWAAEYMYPMDLIHPSNAGYTVMAKTYFNAFMNAQNPVDPIITDNFNRSALGDVWDASTNYELSSGELAITAGDEGWNYLATYKAMTNPTQITMKIAGSASAGDNEFWGLAVMLDAPIKTAGGYFIRITSAGIELWALSNGSGYGDDYISTVSIGGVTLQPGDTYQVRVSTDGAGHHFDVYINGNFAGRVTDAGKVKGNSDPAYAGIFLRGGQSSHVDDFNLFKSTDKQAPDAINDLAVGSASANSIQLNWIAPGDDGASGNASGYDIRYSQSIISESNFAQATPADDPISPASPGTFESFAIGGLVSDTKYFFAIKTYDEAGNTAPISNVVSAATSNALGFTDEFDRETLGSDWVAGAEYQITNGALTNTATDDSWEHIAIFSQRKNPIEASIVWDEAATAGGIDKGGLALMMSDASTSANGYLVWRRTGSQKIGVWQIVSGVLGDPIDGGLHDALLPTPPQAGDRWRVAIRADQSGHHFDFYINGEYDGTVSDYNKYQGTGEILYAGIVLNGTSENNDVESFSIVNTVGEPAAIEYVSGYDQEGAVGRPLPGELVARVTDKDGMPVSDVKVDFIITAGGGHFDKEVASDGNIRIEAEDAEMTSMYAEQDANCSGEAYITGGNAGERAASVAFRFYIPVADDYFIKARVNPRGNYQQNSWYWKYDDSQERIWDSRPIDYNGWIWDAIGYRGGSAQERYPDEEYFTFSFAVGWHTLTLLQLDKNTKLDKIVISNNASFSPDGKDEYPEYRSDGAGEVRAIWTLGNTFGTNNNRAIAQSLGLSGSPIEYVASATGDVPQDLSYVSGRDQSGAGGEQLPQPLVVRVTDQYGNPNTNYPVTFTVTGGGGSMASAQPVLTDGDGNASDYLILGTENNITSVEASAFDGETELQGSPVPFTATATSKIAYQLKVLRGDDQNANVDENLPNPLEVQILDDKNNPIPNHNVRFRVAEGSAILDGSHSDITKPTDANGKASVTVKMSTTVDSNKVEVSALKMGGHLVNSPHNFISWSRPLAATKLSYYSGKDQTGAAGNALGSPLVVKITDQYNNAVTGHSVTFTVTNGGGSIEGQPSKSVNSDGAGLAAVVLTLGNDEREVNLCVATAVRTDNGQPLDGSGYEFSASAGKVSKMMLKSDNNLVGSAGYQLDKTFIIEVQDNYGNPVPGFGLEYEVTQGSGHINGAIDTTINTQADGRAYCNFTLGHVPGVVNLITVHGYRFGAPLEGDSIILRATAEEASDYQYENGSGPKVFSGTTGEPLADSIKTKVIDQMNHAMKYFPVTYVITGGGGKVNGQDSVVVLTNSQGFAAVSWQLGPLPGTDNNLMEGRAYFDGGPITHSPRKFRASAGKGNASKMLFAAEIDSQKSVVGSMLENPMQIQVTDMAGNAITGHQVKLRIISGGGKLNDVVTEANPYTDGQGYVQANWRIGNEQGWVNALEVSSKYDGADLIGSPHTFYAYGLPSDATALVRVSAETINGQVGAPLGQPFQIKVTDNHQNGIAGMQVTFEIIAGGGTLDGDTDTLKVISSEADGLCSVTLTLGPVINVDNVIKVSAFNAAIELNNSPMYFHSIGEPGPVDLDVSQVICDPVLSPAGETVNVTVALTDAYGNAPASRYWVRLEAEGEGAVITKPIEAQTDEYGRAYGQMKSNKSGVKCVKAEVTFSLSRKWLTNPGTVRFIPLIGNRLGGRSGDNQTGNVNAALADPLGITVYDVYDNPVPDWPVTFSAVSGGCEIYEPQPVETDSTGQAYSHLVLGPNTGTNSASVTTEGIEQTRSYSANGIEGQARFITIYTGDKQSGTAGVELPQPLVVKVTDAQGRPVYNHIIRFAVEFGSGSFKGAAETRVASDAMGLASAYYTLGKNIGPNYVRAESPELFSQYGEFVKFSIDGTAGVAKVLHKITQDGGNAPVYGKSAGLQVRTTDFFGNGVGDVEVTYCILSGDASLEQSQPVVTNSQGYTSTSIRFGGTVGPVEVEAAATDLVNSPIKFLVFATSAGAVSMEIAAGDSQSGTIGRSLTFPFEVLVNDGYGNPVKGTPVYWTVKQGYGIMLQGGGNNTTYSEEDGIARNYLQLGPNTGYNEVHAFNGGLTGTPLAFMATGVTNNFPLVTPEIGDREINEQETVNFTVEAVDDDNDVLTFGLKSTVLPSGASFDSMGTHQFSWTPNYQQAGEYPLWFVVYDNRGGIGAEQVVITVNNQNRPPTWKSRWPLRDEISADKLTGEPVSFSVSVTDPDVDDEITYRWYLKDLNLVSPDSILVSTQNVYSFLPNDYGVGPFNVKVEVSDGYDTLVREWKLSNKVAVELSNFSARILPYKGVSLVWETNYERNNMGFNILRSVSRGGDYQRLTRVPVPANDRLKYEFVDNTVTAGRTYYYRLEDVSNSGQKTMHPAIEIRIERPKTFELSQNYPNPFNPITRIRYQLPEATKVQLVIYNIRGQKVQTLIQEDQPAGYHFAVWDGRNATGRAVASGIYFYLLQTENFRQIRRMVLLK